MGFLKGLTEMVTSTMSMPGAVLHDVVHAPENIFVTKSNKSLIEGIAPKTSSAASDALSHGTNAIGDLLSGKLY